MLQVYALVMMDLLAMTVRKRYQHPHPVLAFRPADYVLLGRGVYQIKLNQTLLKLVFVGS
jgi:hypothetical protein